MKKMNSMLLMAMISVFVICGCIGTESEETKNVDWGGVEHRLAIAKIEDTFFQRYDVDLYRASGSKSMQGNIFKYRDRSGNRITTITSEENEEYADCEMCIVFGCIGERVNHEISNKKICQQKLTITTQDATRNNKVHTARLDEYTKIIYDPINDVIYPDLDCYGVSSANIEKPYGKCLVEHLKRLALTGDEYYVIGQQQYTTSWITTPTGEDKKICEDFMNYVLHIVRT